MADSAPAKRLDWIDALRGYAILAVIAYHTFQRLIVPLSPGMQRVLDFGATGVQLFFMVSAFTIFFTLHEAQRAGRLSYRAFFIRRIMRITPLFYLTLFVNAFLIDAHPQGFPYADFFGTLTFTSAWIPALCPTLVAGGWSIAVEMWFYLLAPLLVFSIRNLRQALYFAFGALVLRACINEGLTAFLTAKPRLFASFLYFWLPNQLPLFALGIVLFFLYEQQSMNKTEADADGRASSQPAWLFLLAGLYLLVASIQGFKALLPFHFLFGLAFLLIIVYMFSQPGNALVNAPLVGLGKISYSAYICHFFVIDYSYRWFLGLMGAAHARAGLQFAAFLLWVLLLTSLVSWCLYRAVEKPGQAFGKYLIRRHLSRPAAIA